MQLDWVSKRKEKIKNFERKRFQRFQKKASLIFNFHGLSLKLNSDSLKLIDELMDYLPPSWIRESDGDFIEINHISVAKEDEFLFWDDPDSTVIREDDSTYIHRDFVAKKEGPRLFTTTFQPEIGDGLHNFFRWLISPRLVSLKKAMLHCAAIKKKNGFVDLFLGPSGAGKTTITELAKLKGSERKVLSDDMNLISFNEEGLHCYAGGVGGLYKPEVELSQSFVIENMFWLCQGEQIEIKEMTEINKRKRLLASFANISWKENTSQKNQHILNLVENILAMASFKELVFPKDKILWKTLDP